MATTVFPVTDQTVTKTLWDGMAEAIDRGEVDPVSAINSTDDTARLQYYGTQAAGSTDSNADFHEIASLNVDQGQAFYFQGLLEIDETNSAAPSIGDALRMRVRLTSGLKAYYFAWTVSDPQIDGTGITISQTTQTSPSNTFDLFLRSAVSLVAGDPAIIEGVIFGDTASGSMNIDIVKDTDATSNEYVAGAAITLIGRRIW